jgi:hypothetical protein
MPLLKHLNIYESLARGVARVASIADARDSRVDGAAK